jgi:hypothetical protein
LLFESCNKCKLMSGWKGSSLVAQKVAQNRGWRWVSMNEQCSTV